MRAILERLERGPLLLDGAMGTELWARGWPRERPADAAVLERPELVSAIHLAYREAGAEVLTTATFGAHAMRLDPVGLGKELVAINKAATALAREAAGPHGFVAGSVGPPGRNLHGIGDLSFRTALGAYRVQMTVLLDAGVDLLLLETFTDTLDLQAALQVARELGGPVPVAASFALSGLVQLSPPTALLQVAQAMGAEIVGVNCVDPESALATLAQVRPFASRPLLFMPSAGEPTERDGHLTWPVEPGAFAEAGRRAVALGARLLGGCCGTTPAHIQALHRVGGATNPTK